jgi:hypothetical protein
LQHFVDQVVLMSEQSAMNEVFLRNTIQHLNKALLSTELINETLSSPQELQLAAVLVSVLLEFLRGKLSGCCFVYHQSLTQRRKTFS